MLSRSLRPVAARVSSLATNPNLTRSSVLLGRLSIRTFANATDATTPISEPASIPPASEVPASRQLPYYIGRNNLNNLGVYHKRKRGGNYKITMLKYGEGDLMALKQDLKAALQLPESEISINSVTNHIVIRGHRRDEVLNFIHTMGF